MFEFSGNLWSLIVGPFFQIAFAFRILIISFSPVRVGGGSKEEKMREKSLVWGRDEHGHHILFLSVGIFVGFKGYEGLRIPYSIIPFFAASPQPIMFSRVDVQMTMK